MRFPASAATRIRMCFPTACCVRAIPCTTTSCIPTWDTAPAITGFDIDSGKVNTLNRGDSYIVRITGSEIQSAQKNGFSATGDYSRIAQMDVVIICVPTPLNNHHEPDLSYITGTVKSLAPYVHEGQLIILESTTYPGTTEEVMVPLLEKGNPAGLKVARDASNGGFYVAF